MPAATIGIAVALIDVIILSRTGGVRHVLLQ